jgi:hypothetical protein
MFKKTTILAAAAAGYVLGARAGRERYEQIVDAAGRVKGNPQVQKAAAQAQDFAAEQAPVVKEKAQQAADKAAGAAKSATNGSDNSNGSNGAAGSDLPGTAENPAKPGHA